MDKVRFLALEIKDEIESNKAYSQIRLSETLKSRDDLSRRDKALITEIVSGSIRMQGAIDWMISRFAKQSLGEIAQTQLNILRIAIYQIVYIGNIPDYAAVDEAVNQSKKKFGVGMSKFTNGLLRNFLRKKDDIKWPDRTSNSVAYLSAYYSHPKWMVKKIIDDLGVDECEKILISDNKRPKISLRVNTVKTTKAKVKEELTELEMDVVESPYADEALVIEDGFFPHHIIGEGKAYAQDISSMIVSHVVGPVAGETVIDMCGGPGGKATHLAQLMENKGKIIVVDKNKRRLTSVQNSAKLLGIEVIELKAGDSTLRVNNLPVADRVLVDAPCSGLGVLSRRADLRWQRSPDDIKDLQAIQRNILKNSANYVKKGGKLIYSVCTFTKEETLDVVDHFMKSRDDFEIDDLSVSEAAKNIAAKNAYIQLMPYDDQTDGMFITRFTRK